MEQEKALTINKEKIFSLAWFTTLLVITMAAPLMHNQAITGPLVNATLFIAVLVLGTKKALFVGIIPSIVALSVGTLPGPLAPMVPFIMISNVILIAVFGWLKNKNYWLGVFTASALKFVFLFSTSFVVINFFFKKELAAQIAGMMSWSQFITAFGGGIIAYVFFRIVRTK